jgi:lipoate-protein ligase A
MEARRISELDDLRWRRSNMPGERSEWRFLGITSSDGAGNMAIDEAIMLARAQDLVPNTVRLYMWKPAAVSLGYFLKANDAADVEECRNLGIDVVRRTSGGGAVYHSENEITYSVIVNQDDLILPKDLIEVYKKFSAAIIDVPRKLGLQASFEPGHPGVCPNMVVAGRKISGNAQARKKGVILQHGTLLLDCNLEVMAKVLKIPYELITAKVTTLKKELDSEGLPSDRITEKDFEGFQRVLREGFEESLGIKLVDGELTPFENREAERLKVKYSSREWTYMR